MKSILLIYRNLYVSSFYDPCFEDFQMASVNMRPPVNSMMKTDVLCIPCYEHFSEEQIAIFAVSNNMFIL